MKIVERLLRWIEYPINALFWAGMVAGFLMMIHVTVDVAGRTLFNHPFAGTTEIVSGWYMVAVAYLPWAWITRHDNHIVAGVFEQIGTPRFAYWLETAVKIFMLVYVGVFTWQTHLRAVQQTRAGEVWEAAGGFILVWPSRWLLPISAGLMAAYLVLRIIRDIARGYRPKQKTDLREGGI
ncbi:MAG: TRAP transporter small permease [Bradyrhizobiaceae bacterium]|nr:TRAP transporter small permease [Bradyrhizobiaceae bacterium]